MLTSGLGCVRAEVKDDAKESDSSVALLEQALLHCIVSQAHTRHLPDMCPDVPPSHPSALPTCRRTPSCSSTQGALKNTHIPHITRSYHPLAPPSPYTILPRRTPSCSNAWGAPRSLRKPPRSWRSGAPRSCPWAGARPPCPSTEGVPLVPPTGVQASSKQLTPQTDGRQQTPNGLRGSTPAPWTGSQPPGAPKPPAAPVPAVNSC